MNGFKLERGSDSAVGTPAYTDAWWVFDARASYRLTKNVDIQSNVCNLLDWHYLASFNLTGVPRSARITANFAF